MCREAAIALLLVVSTGCAHAPQKVSASLTTASLPASWAAPVTESAEVPDLWRLVTDGRVRDLMAAALERNPNLAQTSLRVAEAEALLNGQRGLLWPALDMRGQSRATRSDGRTVDSGLAGASVTWEADLWGRLRSSTSAAAERLNASEADLLAARNSLAASVLRTLLELTFSRAIIEVEERRIKTLQLNEQLIRERYLVGLGALADLEAARTTLAQAGAGLLDRQERYSRGVRALRVLVGDYSLEPGLTSRFAVELPGSAVPIAVLRARPDIAAAMARASAANADADAAAKALLPGVSLSLDQTRSASSIGNALSADGVSVLLLGVTAPLFQGGRLRAERSRTELVAERQLFALREALLQALREVDDAVVLEASLKLQTEQRALAQRFSRDNRTLFESRYRDGIANIFDLLNAQQTAYDAEVQLLNAQLLQNQNRVDLGLALGLGL